MSGKTWEPTQEVLDEITDVLLDVDERIAREDADATAKAEGGAMTAVAPT